MATALRRISDLVTALDDDRRGAAEQAETRRLVAEEIDLLWRTSQLRANATTPIDEAPTASANFYVDDLPGCAPGVPGAGRGPPAGRGRAGAPAGAGVPPLWQRGGRPPRYCS